MKERWSRLIDPPALECDAPVFVTSQDWDTLEERNRDRRRFPAVRNIFVLRPQFLSLSRSIERYSFFNVLKILTIQVEGYQTRLFKAMTRCEMPFLEDLALAQSIYLGNHPFFAHLCKRNFPSLKRIDVGVASSVDVVFLPKLQGVHHLHVSLRHLEWPETRSLHVVETLSSGLSPHGNCYGYFQVIIE